MCVGNCPEESFGKRDFSRNKSCHSSGPCYVLGVVLTLHVNFLIGAYEVGTFGTPILRRRKLRPWCNLCNITQLVSDQARVLFVCFVLFYKEQTFISHSSGGWEIQDQGTRQIQSFATSYFLDKCLSPLPSRGRGKGRLALWCLFKGFYSYGLPVNIQGWFPLVATGLISLLSKGLSGVFSNTTIRKHQFFSAQPEGKRRSGQQRVRWLDSIASWTDMNLSKFQKTVEDRGAWCAAVHGFTKLDTT